MRTGITIHLSQTDRKRLQAIIDDRNRAQKHVWRAMIVVATAEGLGTAAIMRTAGVSKTAVWRWQERFMSEGQVGATLSALDRLIPGLGGIARQNAAPGLVAALGQKTVLEGKPAVAFPVRFADGTVFLGPFQVGVVPPVF